MNIMGTEYKILKGRDSYLQSIDADGVCESYEKLISVRSEDILLDQSSTPEAKTKRYKEVMRHEIIHAFFHECGLDDYSNDEVLVNFLAIQFPKLKQLFEDINCLD